MNFKKLNQLTFDTENPDNAHVYWGDGKLPLRPQFNYTGVTESDYRLIIQAKSRIDEMVHNAVFEYVNEEDLCNCEEDMFPRADHMTGNYYIGSEYYSTQADDDSIYCSVDTRFTGLFDLPNSTEPKEQDYLGLEVLFSIYKCGKVKFQGVNSSCI
jgi:hypothetical protein